MRLSIIFVYVQVYDLIKTIFFKLALKFFTIFIKIFVTNFQNRQGESSNLGTPGTRTSSVLPDLLSQASPATPPRHDKSSSEEVIFSFYLNFFLSFVHSSGSICETSVVLWQNKSNQSMVLNALFLFLTGIYPLMLNFLGHFIWNGKIFLYMKKFFSMIFL